MSNSLNKLPEYNTKLFSDIFTNMDNFVESYIPEGIAGKPISDDNARQLYVLLYAKYGNNPIINLSESQFRFKIYQIIFQYGPTWEKRLSIQKTLREMTEDDILAGAKQITNHSFNPSTSPSTDTLDELQTIDDQNVNKHKRSKLDGYSMYMDLIKTDVTEEFLNRFKPLFKTFVSSSVDYIYRTEEEEE